MRIGSAVSAVYIVPVEEPVVIESPVPIAAELQPEETLAPVG
jgi:hypothetical protein